jgi:hypothetical protein
LERNVHPIFGRSHLWVLITLILQWAFAYRFSIFCVLRYAMNFLLKFLSRSIQLKFSHVLVNLHVMSKVIFCSLPANGIFQRLHV